MRIARTIALVTVCLLLATGCGKKNSIDGTYHDSSGLMTFELYSGKVDVTVAGMTRHGTYQISGKSVTLRWDNGRVIMDATVNPDGSLVDNSGGHKLIKGS
jgi:hypothetical protein